jgi:hypothetical protein
MTILESQPVPNLDPYALLLSYKTAINSVDRNTPEGLYHFQRTMVDLWKALPQFSEAEFSDCTIKPNYQELNAFFKEMERLYTNCYENAEAAKIQAVRGDTQVALAEALHGVYPAGLEPQVQAELALMENATPPIHKIVIVGFGAFPATIFHLQNHLPPNTHFTCLDADPSAVAVAQNIITKFNLPNIDLIQAFGSTYDFSGTDLAHITGLCRGKQEIIDQFYETANSHAHLLVRTPIGFARMVYESVSPKNQSLVHLGTTETNDLLLQTLLFQKA